MKKWIGFAVLAVLAFGVMAQTNTEYAVRRQEADAAWAKKDWVEAEALYRAAAKAQGATADDIAGAQSMVAHALGRQEKFSDAVAIWEQLLVDHPNWVPAQNGSVQRNIAGAEYRADGDIAKLAQAVDEIRRIAGAVADNYPQALRFLGARYLDSGRKRDAIKTWEEAEVLYRSGYTKYVRAIAALFLHDNKLLGQRAVDIAKSGEADLVKWVDNRRGKLTPSEYKLFVNTVLQNITVTPENKEWLAQMSARASGIVE
jgi:tetratricopeptide (TPR) repeat protein